MSPFHDEIPNPILDISYIYNPYKEKSQRLKLAAALHHMRSRKDRFINYALLDKDHKKK